MLIQTELHRSIPKGTCSSIPKESKPPAGGRAAHRRFAYFEVSYMTCHLSRAAGEVAVSAAGGGLLAVCSRLACKFVRPLSGPESPTLPKGEYGKPCQSNTYKLHDIPKGSPPRSAFTLVEVLIVLTLMLVLAGIALPTTKKLLLDQKSSRVARSIAAYFAEARSEAIVKGQFVGVRIERLTATNAVRFGSTASIRLKRIAGVPAYSGEAANARVKITAVDPTGIALLEFNRADSFLLTLVGQSNPPIAEGDLIELPGGKMFPLDFTGSTATVVNAAIDLNLRGSVDLSKPNDPEIYSVVAPGPPQVLAATSTATERFPLGHLVTSGGSYPYRIHRKPSVSSSNPLSFSRGIAIDLNYSGIGLGGNQFAPDGNQFAPPPLATPAVNQPIDIFFGPDGRVEFVSTDSQGNVGPAVGMIYLCLGSNDGVADPAGATATLAELFQDDDQVTTNIMSLDSIWIVINPNTGRVVSSPFASVSGTPTTNIEAMAALAAARRLAILSDTLDAAP